MKFETETIVVLVAIGAVTIGAVYLAKKASDGLADGVKTVGDAAQVVGGWLNPTKDTNLAYRGVNSLGEAITGDKHFTLGGAIYDLLNKPPIEKTAVQNTKGDPIRAAIYGNLGYTGYATNDEYTGGPLMSSDGMDFAQMSG